MSTISRRTLIATGAGAAALVTASLPAAPALAADLDAPLFEAIANWRAAKVESEAAHERNEAIHKQAVASFPLARWGWVDDPDGLNVVLADAGWDETECEAEHGARMSAYNRVVATPVHTVEGLRQKIEVIGNEFVWDSDESLDIDYAEWVALRDDIRRLAGNP
jgi:hypothetical protein